MKKNRIIILILPLILTLNSCHVARYFYWNLADFDDYKKFPAETINKGDTAFHFIPSDSFISFEPSRKWFLRRLVLKIVLFDFRKYQDSRIAYYKE